MSAFFQVTVEPVNGAQAPLLHSNKRLETIRDLFSSAIGLLPNIAGSWQAAGSAGAQAPEIFSRTLAADGCADCSYLNRNFVVAIAAGLSVIAGVMCGRWWDRSDWWDWPYPGRYKHRSKSFTGWLLNSFRGYYRVGDRIEAGEVLEMFTKLMCLPRRSEKRVDRAKPWAVRKPQVR